MKFSPSITAALLGATATFSVAGMRMAVAESCTGPVVSCAVAVQAKCSRPDDNQRMTFPDEHANWMRFERCVGCIFEAAGEPNPYKTAAGSPNAGRQAGSGTLTVPYTEMIYPHNYGRD